MIFVVAMAIIFSLFSTTVMSYIAMATPIGPWIGPTLVLLGIPIFKVVLRQYTERSLALSVLSGSVGGIIATALGFSFPTLYFLDPVLFNTWMANPWYFCSFLAIFVIVAGLCALWMTDCFEEKLLHQQKLPFPIGQLMHSMIIAQKEIKRSYELLYGICSTALFCFLQDGLWSFKGIIPKSITLISRTTYGGFVFPTIAFDLWPMLWAIGFITGHVIAIPLAIGALTQIVLVSPVHAHFFSFLSSVEFTLAFCSGMVLSGAFFGFLGLPAMIGKFLRGKSKAISDIPFASLSNTVPLLVVALAGTIIFLTYLKFSLLAQLFLLASTLLWTYQTAFVAGKLGLATLGRYATFVMIPAMLLFKLNYVQIVIVATFVELVGGMTVDLLFGRRLARLAHIDSATVRRFQGVGIFIAALCSGVVFWLLISHFGLGSEQLVAYRAQSRQLLINAQQFNYYVLGIGFLFGVILKYCHVNAALVLGGLLMPLNLSLGLVFGGLCTLLVRIPSAWEPYLSGVFAFNALWMVLKVFC
jgi:hypothetical protein